MKNANKTGPAAFARAIIAMLAAGALLSGFLSCERPSEQSSSSYKSTADAEVVSSHVQGAISSEARLIVRFVKDIAADDRIGKSLPAKAASIQPAAPGDFVFADRKTIEFKPSKPLTRGTVYKVSIDPGKLDSDVVKNERGFYFNFSLLNQTVSLNAIGLESSGGADIREFVWKGIVATGDIADPAEVEKALSVEVDGKKARIEWTHGKVEHRFTALGIKKTEKPRTLMAILKGGIVSKEEEREIEIEIPPASFLVAESAVAVESPERRIDLSFSAPLLKDQDFRGFITVKPARKLKFAAEGSILKVYSLSDWDDAFTLVVAKGLKDAAGEPSKENAEFQLSFAPLLPMARYVGNGVIVPAKPGVTVPIETVNLSGVIVRVEKIYADKIDQFLQVNELSESKELNRVGKTVWEKIVPVPFAEAKRNQWIRTGLDLSPLIREDGHSLYRVTLSFDIRMSEYPGADVPESELLRFDLKKLEQSGPSDHIRQLGDSFWDDYAGRKNDGWDWKDYRNNKKNPNHPAFFSDYFRRYYWDEDEDDEKALERGRNFLVSDIGIIAQVDANKTVTAAVTSLLTAEPLKDAVVTAYDFRQRILGQGRTDGNGLVSLKLPEDGFLLVAESKDDKGFLKLQGASNIPVSHFDVAGQEVQQGVKGFIYGERGVWRPGDPIYLTFILKDGNHVLPPEHPVIMRLYDPSGKLVKTIVKDEGVGNFYHFALKTGRDDPTGTYSAKVSVGGLVFSKDVPVETIKPNRLKIDAGFADGVTELGLEPARMKISAAWLHGAIAGDMRTDVSVRFFSTPTTFAGYKEFAFDDPVRNFRSESDDVFKGELDSQGRAEFTLKLDASAASPGKLMANFRTRVYEPGGNVNADTFTAPFSPYARYAGLSVPDADKEQGWLNVEKPHAIKIALVDPSGKPVDGPVEIEIYELGWRWWWDRDEEEIADFLGSKDYRLVQSAKVNAVKGSAEWSLRFADRVWGRHLIRVKDPKGGHATGRIVYMRWPGWYYSSPEGGGDSAATLVFSSDKDSYAVGETARITIPTPDEGRALVSIENNGRLLSTEWVDAKAGQTAYDLKISPSMAPNVYVHVSMVQPHGQTVNDRPIRMFGIIPLLVEDPATRLSPVLETADTYEPDGIAKLSVSEKSGKAMSYTIAIVDEGLLNITRFKTPDPRAHFFRRDALAVNTFDVYGFVAAAYGGTLERLLAIGGGDEGDSGEGRKANRFPPMVKFLGPFPLAAGKSASHDLKLPQYVGAVRVMVVAGNDAAYGFAEKTVPVKKPVMVYATLPRVISVTERFALPATIFALEEGVKSVDVTVKTNGKIMIDGPAKKTLQFAKPGDQLVVFEALAGNVLGVAEIEITATSGKTSSTQKIEIDVRSPNPPVTTVEPVYLKKGEKQALSVKLPGLPGSNSVTLEISNIVPIDLKRRLDFLIHYPYGCIEQTTSSVFPQLYLDRITELDANRAAEVRRNVQAGIDRLRSFRTYSGGLSYWPGDGSPDAWGTTYAGHFVLEAERLGYIVPSDFKRGIVNYLKSQASAWAWRSDRSDFVQAYALYDLALAGEPDLGAMNRMRERKGLPPEVKFKLAGAYALAGQKDEALRLIAGKIPPLTPYKELGGTYGSDLRDLAILGEGLLESGAFDLAAPIVSEVSKSLSSMEWYSTQTTSYCLLVVGKYLAAWKSDSPLKVAYEWDGQKGAIETAAPMKSEKLTLKSETTAIPLKISNDSDRPVYVRVIKTGQAAPGNEKAWSNGLSLTVKYFDEDGKFLNVDSLPQGEDIVAEIAVKNISNRRYYEELALDYYAPSGWEITNPRFEGWVQDKESGFEYQDFRDDRVYTFLSLRPDTTKTLKLMMTATYKGKFYLPQAKAEAMYDASISAATEGRWITVTEGEAE